MFISIDGIDGGGKSTQLQLLESWYLNDSIRPVMLRDPGSTRLGESVREILLHQEEIELCPESEMLLYMAARAQLIQEKILPALEQGETVICDRFLLANVVYQGYGGGLDVENIWKVGQIATKGLRPDLTIVLDLPVPLAMKRVGVAQDRLEKRGEDYFERVRRGFREQMDRASTIAILVDASQSAEDVHRTIVEHLVEYQSQRSSQ